MGTGTRSELTYVPLTELARRQGGIPMSEELLIAMGRARQLVEEIVWIRLSPDTRAGAIHEELRLLKRTTAEIPAAG